MLMMAPMLSGCGGGGGGGSASRMDVPVEPTGLAFDRDNLAGIIGAAQFLSHSPGYSPDGSGSALAETEIALDIADLRTQVPESYELIEDEAFNGATVARTPAGTPEVDGNTAYHRLGGWLDHSYFEARVAVDADGSGADGFDTALAYSMGAPTGSNPAAGSATWKGATVGLDTGPRSSWPFVGSATLTVDFSPYAHLPDVATVDVVLGSLRRVADASYGYDDMRFEDVPIIDGEFADEHLRPQDLTEFVMRYRISGGFYGPGHEEAGGSFVIAPTEDYREGVMLGAFGAKRED